MQSLTESAKLWLARAGLIGIIGLGVVAAVFLSAIFFALFLVLALIGSAVFWWKMRRLERQAEQEFQTRHAADDAAMNEDFLEVEYQVLETEQHEPSESVRKHHH